MGSSLEVGALSADGSRVWTGRYRAVNRVHAPLSDDGLHYWDGRNWVSTISPDGQYRWTGSTWSPVAATAPGPAYPYYQRPVAARVATPWTQPMQYAVAGWYLITGLFALSLPFWMSSVIYQAFAQGLSVPYPSANPPPQAIAFISIFLWMSAFVAVAISAFVILGALKRWTWVFYVVMVLFGLSCLSLPGSISDAMLGPTPHNLLPSWNQWIFVSFAVSDAAIFGWMLVAVFRYGPWATIKTAS